MTSQLALHPEPLPETGDAWMRWALPESLLPVGRLLAAPGTLGTLLTDAEISAAWCEPHALRLRLRHGLAWRQNGDRIRSAIQEAAADLPAWRTDGDRNAVLRLIVDDVLAGRVGAYITSHGGSVEVVEVADDAVTVTFAGTCGHCPAAGQTLHDRLETAVRQRYPDLRRVVEAPGQRPTSERGQPLLLRWPARRKS